MEEETKENQTKIGEEQEHVNKVGDNVSNGVNHENENKAKVVDGPTCATAGCGKPAPLQCPKCIELKLKPAHFCSQPCFKSSYSIHKLVHSAATNGANNNKRPTSEASLILKYPTFRQTGELMPYKQTPMKQVPRSIERPDYADDPRGIPRSEISSKKSGLIEVLSPQDIEGVKRACVLGREVIEVAARMIRVGVTTDEIDAAVHQACLDRDCYPSPLNYYTFPKSCCTSVNEVVCHGIPDLRPLQDGDIVNIDISLYHKGFHADLNETYFVGKIDSESQMLVTTAFECLDQAIKAVKPGMRYRDVGAIIQKHAQANKCSVVRTYCGHGVHRLFHCAPTIPHYAKNKAIGVMKPGHCFTIEPMINAGKFHDETWPDNWTSVTCDGKRSAQFEHTLLVTETGCEILTKRPDSGPPAFFMQQVKEAGLEPYPTVKAT